MNPKTKVRDRVRDETEKIRKTTKKLNSKIMEKVKIKRVKRNKKKATTGEKVLAAVGLGSTLLGGAGAVSSQPKATQFVRTQTNEKGSKTQGIKDKLREIFGIKQAKAAGSVDAAQAALTAAENALSNFDAWVSSATADVPKFAPEDQAQRQNDIDAEVARTRPGLEQAVSAAQAAYNQAVADAQGPQEGDTKTEGGVNYTFYQGSWVINNGQTKNEGGFSYGSEGGQWILLDGQTKTENGKTYISSGGQWVEKPADVQAPQIGETKTGADGYQYVFSNSIYASGAWTLADGQTKAENGKTFVVQGGTWVEQQSNQPKEGDTKTENGRSYHFSGGQWVDNAGNRVQNPNSFWYIADGNGDWTLADGQSKSEGGFQYGSLGGGWILLDGQTKTENGVEYISSGGQWVEKPAGVEAPKIGDVQTGADGYQYVFSDSLYPTGAWTLVDGQTKTENGKNYTVQGGTWVQEQTGAQEGDTKTENGLSYHFTGGQWVDNAGNRVQNPNSFWYIADGNGNWTLVDNQTKIENGKSYKTQNGGWVEVVAGTTVDLNNLPESFDLNSDLAKSLGFSPDAPVIADSGVPAQYVVVGDTVYKWQNGSFVKVAQGSAATTFINGASGMSWYQNGGGIPGAGKIFIGAGTGALAGAAIGSMFTVAATAVTSSITFAGAAGASAVGTSVAAGSTAGPIGAVIGAAVGGAIMGIQAIVNRGQDKVRDTKRIESAYPYFNEIMQQYWSITPNSPEEAKALHDAAQQAIQGIFDQIQFEKDSSRTDQQRWLQQNFYNGLDENLTNWQNSFQSDFSNLGVFEQPNGTRIAYVGSWGQIRVDASGKLLSWENQNDVPPPPSVIAAIKNRTETTKIGAAQTGTTQTGTVGTGVILTPAEVIVKAQTTSWDGLSAEEQKIFTDYFSNGQHIADIPANFSADSSFAYALGLGGAREGDTKGLNGLSYKLEGGNWVVQTPETTSKVNYEVWRTEQGVGAYYNETYGFVTLTTDGKLVDQNGNVITEPIAGNYQLQGLMFQLHSADVDNTVMNPDFKPVAVANLTGQALIDQANNGSVDWNKLTPAQQQELAGYFGNHPELLPQTITPGSALAYMLGLGTSTDANDPTVIANADKAGLEFKDGQWVKKAAATTVIFTTNSGNTATPKVGDTWTITITGPVGAPVFSTANGSTTQMGVIGADGKLVLTGTFKAGDVGTWNQQWTVGEGASQLQAGNIDFKLTASQSNQVEQTVPFGLETVSFTVKDNGNGTFSIIYNGNILVTGSSKADIDAARAKFPFMYSTPEAVVLSTVSNGFNNYFLTIGSQIKLDNGTRTTVSTTEKRDVFRDSNGNAAGYFNEFGGRIYYNRATGDLYREDKDGNYVKMELSEISPQTRQNIISVLTGIGSNITVTTVTHNLLSELGQPVKGPNLKQDPKDGNWYVTDDKGDFVLDANGKRIQANLQRFVWSPGGWSSWGYNVEGLNEEMAKYATKQYTVDVVTAPNGAKSYTLTVTLPDGKPVTRTFLNASEFNNFLATNFTTSNAFMDMSPADKAIFMAATDARIHFPELTASFIGNTPAARTNHRIIWVNPNNGMLEVQGLINPTYMSTYQQAQSLQSLFPGSQIKERLPLGWPGVVAYEYDPGDPRRVYEVILSDGTVLNVSNAMNSIKQDGQTLTVQGFPQNVVNQIKPPTGTKVNALFVGGVGYGSAADNANAANGLVEPGSFGPSANPTYSGAIVPFQWLNLGNGQGGIVDPASPYTTNKQNGLNPNQGVVNTGVTPITTTTNTNTLLNNLFTLPINTGSGSGTGGSAGGNTGGTGAGVGTGTLQTAPMPSITRVSSQKLKPGDTIQITGQNITQGTTLAELVNQKGSVVGLTVVSSTSGNMTVKLPQSGLESGQYTIQLRFVGTGANFGKVSSGVLVSVESATPAGTAGAQVGAQGQAGVQSATGQAAQLAAPISVGEDLGKNPANGKSIFLTHLAVYTQNNVNTLGKVAPGSIIELGGQGLSAFNKHSLVIDGQEYEIKKFSAGDNVIKLTVPTNLPASLPAGSAVQVKLYSAYQGVKQGAVSQELLYAAGQDAQAQSIEYDNSSTDTGDAEQADSQDTEAEVETTADTEETGVSTETVDGAEVEAAEDTVLTDSASQDYWNNLNNGAGGAVGNVQSGGNLLRADALGASSGQGSLSADEVEAGAEEEANVVNADSGSTSYWSGLNASGGNTAVGTSGAGSSGGVTQIRGGTNGIRGTIGALGTADQAWTGGLKMPEGYPASGGLKMPDTALSDGQESLQAETVTHKVKKGDTLWSIAKKHYGDGKKWRKILEANLDKVRDPKKLKIGAELVIPKI